MSADTPGHSFYFIVIIIFLLLFFYYYFFIIIFLLLLLLLLLLTNCTKWNTNNVRIEFKYPAILCGYLDSWLFCTVNETCLTSRLRALRFSIRSAFPAL